MPKVSLTLSLIQIDIDADEVYSFKNSSIRAAVISGNLLPFFTVHTSPINEP
jgi:hypothetical protein